MLFSENTSAAGGMGGGGSKEDGAEPDGANKEFTPVAVDQPAVAETDAKQNDNDDASLAALAEKQRARGRQLAMAQSLVAEADECGLGVSC